MNRRSFFKLAAGVLGALALPVPKKLTNADIWVPLWGSGPSRGLIRGFTFRTVPTSIVDKLTELEASPEEDIIQPHGEIA